MRRRNIMKSSGSNGGIGFVGLLTIVFITLKLTGYITWSWWWVLSPLWIVLLIFVAVLVLGGIGWLLWTLWKSKLKRRKK